MMTPEQRAVLTPEEQFTERQRLAPWELVANARIAAGKYREAAELLEASLFGAFAALDICGCPMKKTPSMERASELRSEADAILKGTP